MDKIRTLMIKHPLISVSLLMPICLLVVISIFSIIINIVLPALLAIWLAGWVYTAMVGERIRKYYREPFWFIHYRSAR